MSEHSGGRDRGTLALVDEDDHEVGRGEKLSVHREGLLHRAFSVFLLSPGGRQLLQRRAAGKYHSGGLWTNACCGHPAPGEDVRAAAVRRTREELGVRCHVEPLFRFRYELDVGGGLTENELTHAFVGTIREALDPDPEEVAEVRWVTAEALERELRDYPEMFTPWFRLAMDRFPAALAESEQEVAV